jgi:hypothetical protein
MTTHPRNAVLIALLGSVCVFGAETAQAQKPLIRFNSIASTSAQTRIPKVKPVARMNTVKIAPRLRNDGPNLTRRLPPTYQLDLTKLKTSGSKRGRSPSNANNATALPTAAHIARRPNLRSPNLGRQIPAGNLATARNLLPNPSGVKQNGPAARAGAQGNASVPLPPQPPVDDNLADAITVTGGAPDWWKAFEQWSDLATAGPGNFQPESLPDGRGERPELDPDAFSPDRSGESGERGIGPRGSPGGAQGNSPFSDPSGKVSNGWVVTSRGSVRLDMNLDGRDDATYSYINSKDDQGHEARVTTVRNDDGRITEDAVYSDREGNVDRYITYYANGDGTGKTIHTRNGVLVNDVPLNDPIVITAGEDTGEDTSEDEGDEKGSGNPEDSQPGAEAQDDPAAGRAMCAAIGGAASMAASPPPHGRTPVMPTAKAPSMWAEAPVLAR